VTVGILAALVSCFVIVAVIRGCVNDYRLHRALASTTFKSSANVTAFAKQWNLEYQETGNRWEATRQSDQDEVSTLHAEYKTLKHQEKVQAAVAAARKLLNQTPQSGFVDYAKKLREAFNSLDDSELKSQVEQRLTTIEPDRLSEEVETAINSAPLHSDSAYLIRLEAYLTKAPNARIRRKLNSAISDQKDYAEAEAAAAREVQLQKQDQDIADKARELTSTLFREANPQATINWLTYESGVVPGRKRVMVRFEYSVVNAFGARAQHRYSAWWNYDLTKIVDEDDVFLYFRK